METINQWLAEASYDELRANLLRAQAQQQSSSEVFVTTGLELEIRNIRCELNRRHNTPALLCGGFYS